MQPCDLGCFNRDATHHTTPQPTYNPHGYTKCTVQLPNKKRVCTAEDRKVLTAVAADTHTLADTVHNRHTYIKQQHQTHPQHSLKARSGWQTNIRLKESTSVGEAIVQEANHHPVDSDGVGSVDNMSSILVGYHSSSHTQCNGK